MGLEHAIQPNEGQPPACGPGLGPEKVSRKLRYTDNGQQLIYREDVGA